LNIQILKKLTLLFAEDNLVMQQKTADMLRIFFDKVLVVSNGLEAYEVYEDEKVDVILTDIKMPLKDGISFIEKVRKDNYNIPIVVLTSFYDTEILLKVANLSIDGYIVKPIDLNDALNTFCKSVERIDREKKKVINLDEDVIYNLATEELFKNGEAVDLGKKEKKLLTIFIENRDRVMTKEEIIFHIWGAEEISESAFKNLLSRLRAKIGFEMFMLIKGSGWKLKTV